MLILSKATQFTLLCFVANMDNGHAGVFESGGELLRGVGRTHAWHSCLPVYYGRDVSYVAPQTAFIG